MPRKRVNFFLFYIYFLFFIFWFFFLAPVIQEFAEKLLDLPDDFVCRAIDPKVQSSSINVKSKSVNNSQQTLTLIEKSIDYVCDSGQNTIENLRNQSKTYLRENKHSHRKKEFILKTFDTKKFLKIIKK